jgi:hypothetical protein
MATSCLARARKPTLGVGARDAPCRASALSRMPLYRRLGRKRTCAFYYDYFQGRMANPMTANCENRETARRAVVLMGFAEDASHRVKP